MYQQTLYGGQKSEISGKRQRVFLHMSRSLCFCLPRFYSLGIGSLCLPWGFFKGVLWDTKITIVVWIYLHIFFSFILLYYKHYDSHDTVHDGIWVAWRQVMAKDRIEDGYGQ